MALANIQDRLNELESDGTLLLEKGDYAPCVISKPVTLVCDGSTFWTDGVVPAMVIRSSNVTVKDANLRCIATPDHVVFSVEANCHPLLQNVRISGHAVGAEPAPAEWILPPSITTGEINPQHPGFYLELGVPQRAQIVCRISGVSMDPAALGPGINTVKLQIRDAMPDSMLIGEIEVIGSVLTRLIPFFARISTGASSSQDGEAPTLVEISKAEKERFQKLLAGESPRGNARTPEHPKQDAKKSAATANAKPGRRKSKPAQEPPAIQPTATSWESPKSSVTTPASAEETSKLGGAFASNVRNRRLLVYILVDCSKSMSGDPIELVKTRINAIHSEWMNDPCALEQVWISVITFSEKVRQVVPLTDLQEFTTPEFSVANGRALGAALRLLSESLGREISRRTNQQKGDWHPIVFILTNGSPTDSWQEAAADLKSKYKPTIIAVACGDDTDLTALGALTDTVLEMREMSPNDFSKFFWWSGSESWPISSKISDKSHPEVAPKTSPTSAPVLGKLFQSSVDAEPKSESIEPPAPPVTSEPSSTKAKPQNTQHLSKLFTDTKNTK